MPCERPKRIINPRYKGLTASELRAKCNERYALDLARPPDYEIEVPCGKCSQCQKRRLQCFRLRLVYELEKYPNSLFITLSFDDDALEEYKDNYNKAVLQFMDALRKEYGKTIRHFYVLEYGTEHGRPHFHGILFNVPWMDFFKVESIWNRGNGRCRSPNEDYIGFFKRPRGIIYLEAIRDTNKASSYLCKYLTKEYHPDRPTPRVLTSIGFGSFFLTPRNVNYHKKNLDTVMSFGGYPFVLPEYYKRKIFDDSDRAKMVVKSYNEPKEVYYLDGREYYTRKDYKDALKVFHRKNQSLGLSPSDRQEFPKNKRKFKNIRLPENPYFNV